MVKVGYGRSWNLSWQRGVHIYRRIERMMHLCPTHLTCANSACCSSLLSASYCCSEKHCSYPDKNTNAFRPARKWHVENLTRSRTWRSHASQPLPRIRAPPTSPSVQPIARHPDRSLAKIHSITISPPAHNYAPVARPLYTQACATRTRPAHTRSNLAAALS